MTLPVEACEGGREEVMKSKEQAILILGRTLAKSRAPEGLLSRDMTQVLIRAQHSIAELGELIQTTRGMINFFSKAKAAKLLRELVDSFLDMGHTTGKEVMV